MSRVRELAAEHPSQGVEFKPLGEVGTFIRGSGIQKKDLVDAGTPAIHYGQIFTHYSTTAYETRSFVEGPLAERAKKAEPGDLVIATTSENDADVCRAVAWLGGAPAAVSGDAYIYRHQLDPRFVAWFFQSQPFQEQKARHITGTKVRRVNGTDLATIRIPVPPPALQTEIADTLDEFSALTTALMAQLGAELSARSQQHCEYRRTLLKHATEGAPVKLLGDVLINRDSQRRPVTRAAREAGPFPYYGANGVQDYVAGFLFDGTFLLVGEDGSVTRPDGTPVVNWAEGKIWVNNHAHVLEARPDGALLRFVYHYLLTVDVRDFVTGGAQPKLNQGNLNKIEIHLPPRDEQLRIADQLDTAERLVHGLCADLRQEIALRRKQFDFYRDRLLTFPMSLEKKLAA